MPKWPAAVTTTDFCSNLDSGKPLRRQLVEDASVIFVREFCDGGAYRFITAIITKAFAVLSKR